MIREFQGPYRWLSNFAPVLIVLDDITYPSVEHAYVSAKSSSIEWKRICSDVNNTPGKIKKVGRSIILPKDWEVKKLLIMEECLIQKYSQEPFKSKLLATGKQHIQEGNRWGDQFWGVNLYTNKGENRLGKMIMKIRQKLYDTT